VGHRGPCAERQQLLGAQGPARVVVHGPHALLPLGQPGAEGLQRVPVQPGLDGDLHQVAVRVADVDGLDGPERAGARDRALLDGHAGRGQTRFPVGQGGQGEEAEITRARRGGGRPGIDLLAGLVEVDPLLAEAQPGAAFA
jgi:hypothetical protein